MSDGNLDLQNGPQAGVRIWNSMRDAGAYGVLHPWCPIRCDRTMPIRILHLSDLHLGRAQLRDEDFKTAVPGAERRRVIDRLDDYLAALSTRPDFVCITGDLTVRNDPQGFAEFRSWIGRLVDRGVLPSPERVILTPGNHDVAWGVPEEHRFESFSVW